MSIDLKKITIGEKDKKDYLLECAIAAQPSIHRMFKAMDEAVNRDKSHKEFISDKEMYNEVLEEHQKIQDLLDAIWLAAGGHVDPTF